MSFGVHLASGHTPGTALALPAVAFGLEHRSFLVAALLPGAARAIGAKLDRAQREPGPGAGAGEQPRARTTRQTTSGPERP